jgi:Uma2 family endonuclease
MIALTLGGAWRKLQECRQKRRKELGTMATISTNPETAVDYPTSDGRPMAETPLHRRNMSDLIDTLEDRFAEEDDVYVSGNMLLYYIPGDRHRHVAPDVFVVRGIPKAKPRRYYLLWEEGRAPQCIIELTSESTRDEDVLDKRMLYEQVLGVEEYYLFDPYGEYLKPPLQGFRLIAGTYAPIEPIAGRLPSEVLGLHLERDGYSLRLHDPVQNRRLLTPREALRISEAARSRDAAELLQLRQVNEELQRRLSSD